MILRKKGWWLILVFFCLLIGLGCFLYIQPNALAFIKKDSESVKLEQPDPKVFILAKRDVEPAELTRLFKQLKKDQFAIESRPLESLGFTICPTGEIDIYKGSGVYEYYMRRPIPVGAPETNLYPVYPDFLLQVLEFEQDSEAEDQAKRIGKEGVLWEGSCEIIDKAPEKIVVNGTTVYILRTRAEMLRDFTEKYGHQLERKENT